MIFDFETKKSDCVYIEKTDSLVDSKTKKNPH